MEAINHSCPTCKTEAGKPCITRYGKVSTTLHDSRRALAPQLLSNARYTISTKLKKIGEQLRKVQRELEETRAELKQEKVETRRLRRLLESTDVGTIVGLRRRLAEAEAHVRRLKAEVLDL